MIAQDNPTYEKQPNHWDVHGGGLEMLSKAVSGKTKACVSGFVLSKAQQKMVTVSSISSLLHVIFDDSSVKVKDRTPYEIKNALFLPPRASFIPFRRPKRKNFENETRSVDSTEKRLKARQQSTSGLIQVIHSYLFKWSIHISSEAAGFVNLSLGPFCDTTGRLLFSPHPWIMVLRSAETSKAKPLLLLFLSIS